jgi:hypothetical protein
VIQEIVKLTAHVELHTLGDLEGLFQSGVGRDEGAPRRPERGEFPKVNGAGAANAVVSNQRVIVRSPPGNEASRRIFGRNGPAGNALVVLAVVMTVKGAPD